MLSVSLLAQHLCNNEETPALVNWNADSRLDNMTYQHLEMSLLGTEVQGLVLPATSELSASFADYNCDGRTMLSAYNIVTSAMCILRQSIIPDSSGSTGRVGESAGTSGSASEDTLQVAVKSTVELLLRGIGSSDGPESSGGKSDTRSENTLPLSLPLSLPLPLSSPYVSVGLGRGQAGSIWWDALR